MEGREHSGDGAGGDVTFAIDERAESRMEEFLAERAPDVAFYSEDRGMVEPGGEPRWVLVVDPIDGTRPAMAGFESACVSVAAAPLEHDPTMADVEVGCVVEIKSGAALPRGPRRAASSRRRDCRRRRASSGCSGPTASAAGRSSRPRS